jgi:hypothetical protein
VRVTKDQIAARRREQQHALESKVIHHRIHQRAPDRRSIRLGLELAVQSAKGLEVVAASAQLALVHCREGAGCDRRDPVGDARAENRPVLRVADGHRAVAAHDAGFLRMERRQ